MRVSIVLCVISLQSFGELLTLLKITLSNGFVVFLPTNPKAVGAPEVLGDERITEDCLCVRLG